MLEHKKTDRRMGIYLHIPFCLQKCRYCDFYSLPLNDSAILKIYAACLAKEIQSRAAQYTDACVDTIYLGGGTPSLLMPGQIQDLVASVYSHYKVAENAEITLEANPATIDGDYIDALQASDAVNRLSVGIQSFNDRELMMLGRAHSAASGAETLAQIKQAAWNNFNLDVIFGIPGQTMKDWMATLHRVLDYHTAHISMYLLQLEDHVPLARSIAAGQASLPDDDLAADMYVAGIELLEQNGFQHYEISNLCLPGHQCRHNLGYWEGREYAGFGAGAVSYSAGLRWINRADIEIYIQALQTGLKAPTITLEKLYPEQAATEALILGLRMTKGIGLDAFQQRYGINILASYADQIKRFLETDLMKVENGRVMLTKRGILLSNQVLCHFIA